jgi:bacillopeptidase F (M6 metalloprotease family)
MKTLITTLAITFTLGTLAYGEPPTEDLLAGPSMNQEEVTNDDMLSRKLQETGKKNKLNSRKQQQLWMSALEVVDLTNEQKVEVMVLLSGLKEKQQTFHKTYGKEVAAIQKAHREARKNDEVLSDESRKRSMELMGLAPDVVEYQEKAWVILTPDQQTTFQTRYQSLIEEDAKRKEDKKKHPKDETKDRGFGPKDSLIRDKKSTQGGDTIDRDGGSVDEASLRRIKFLRRLQDLDKD